MEKKVDLLKCLTILIISLIIILLIIIFIYISTDQFYGICFNFSSVDHEHITPEIVLITNRTISSELTRTKGYKLTSMAEEFRFDPSKVTMKQLYLNGFNPNAPVTFLIHGFTSGYPLQAWMSAIVESYIVDREILRSNKSASADAGAAKHNLFIVNWDYAARGIDYFRAVSHVPFVASIVGAFIDNFILNQEKISPANVQLIGHSLGAHLAGFIGKNREKKLGRILGLDPAGPCFAPKTFLSGILESFIFSPNLRLNSEDAAEVITIHTDSTGFGIAEPIGKQSIFFEGGNIQPGCVESGSSFLSKLKYVLLDGIDMDSTFCSHSRAPLLFTHRHDEFNQDDVCQMVGYECENFEKFKQGHCGVCENDIKERKSMTRTYETPLNPIKCKRVGLDWQYPKRPSSLYEENLKSKYEQDKPTGLFIRSGDTPPYCVYHYQIVLELKSPFPTEEDPQMSIVIQYSRSINNTSLMSSIANDRFGYRFSDKIYTHLLTTAKKMERINHATILFYDGFIDGHKILKSLQINYMSNEEKEVRNKYSVKLCLADYLEGNEYNPFHDSVRGHRFYFEPC